MHLVRKFKGVGEHLVEFTKASRSIKKAKKESQGQNTGPGKFESEAGSAKQTNWKMSGPTGLMWTIR
ncbi:MAG: hypothetical protein CSH37_10110 [Thalassolituus sp.]|jgi:hypothetical protein|nr:MAG: hypothetical protein CSH37_10110 [Thalassolituus sp.]